MKGSRPFSDAEVRQVAQAFRGVHARRDRALFLVGVRTGFRISELLSLTVGDVYQQGQIVDRVRVARRAMKGKHEGRTVPLHPEAQAALADWLEAWDPEHTRPPWWYVFASRQGVNRPMSRVRAWQIFQAVYDAHGLTGPLGTHAMRKTFANRVYERLGHDLVKTQRALGHQNINCTVQYLSFKEEEIEAAIVSA